MRFFLVGSPDRFPRGRRLRGLVDGVTSLSQYRSRLLKEREQLGVRQLVEINGVGIFRRPLVGLVHGDVVKRSSPSNLLKVV